MESGRSGEGCRAAAVRVSTGSVAARYQARSHALCVGDVSTRTLASRIAHREQRRLRRPRRASSCVADELFADAPGSVLLVHGPGGIGKSVLLREIRRRAPPRAGTPFAVDGRDLPPVPDAIEQALAGAWDAERPLVLIDTYERMSALGGYLRSTLLAVAARERRGRDRRPRRARAGLVRGRLGDGRGRAAAGARCPSTRRARCSSATACATIRARRRSRAGPAGCRWRCGSARPPRARIRRGRPGPTRRRCARTCSACPTAALAGPYADVFALACVARVGHARR